MASVFRFSNAVSDIDRFISTYKRLYYYFIDKSNRGEYFNHEEAAAFLARQGLASSLGAIGEEALLRSTRPDKSRDPLYNQHKSYSEIFRMLGWYEAGSMQTNFKLSEYGEYIAETNDPDILKQLFSLNVLHIVSPNPSTTVRGGNVLRPFPMILKLMYLLDDKISRDELIIGVLACKNDKEVDVLQKTARHIRAIRAEGLGALRRGISQLMTENHLSSYATLGNYTRFPISALKWTNWAVSRNDKTIYGHRPIKFLHLTELGKEQAEALMNIPDIRLSDIQQYDEKTKASFVVLSNLQKLAKIGFDLGEYFDCLSDLQANCRTLLSNFRITDDDYLFFGYQEAPKELLRKGDEILDKLL